MKLLRFLVPAIGTLASTALGAPPANGNFSNAIVLSGVTPSSAVDNTEATKEALRRSGQNSPSTDTDSGRAAVPPLRRSSVGQWKNPFDEPARRR